MKIEFNVCNNVVLSTQNESSDNACGDDNLVMIVLSSLVLFPHVSYSE